jgi:hypothetical protein
MKITFVPGTKEIEDIVMFPKPAKNFIPDWYKDIKAGKDLFNVKKCIPFLDSMSSGYIQTTWCDIIVTEEEDGPKVVFDSEVPIFGRRPTSDMPVDESFYDIEFVWHRPWSTILPDGYSALVVHPLNRIDLPFMTLSGIIDFDKSIHAQIGNIPFYIKKGFTGIIPAGTPMFQILPIKREDWKSETQKHSDFFWEEKIKEKKSISSFYKKQIWQRKSFE